MIFQQVIYIFIYPYIWLYDFNFNIYLEQCKISGYGSSKYVCNNAYGTQINLDMYNSPNCSGNPFETQFDICKLNSYNYANCKAICDKIDCNRISFIEYTSNDCSGYIENKFDIVPGICFTNSTLSANFMCSNGQIQLNIYESNDCLNEPISSNKYTPSSCVEIGGEMITFEGCDGSSNSQSSSTSSTTTPMSMPSMSTTTSSSSNINDTLILQYIFP